MTDDDDDNAPDDKIFTERFMQMIDDDNTAMCIEIHDKIMETDLNHRNGPDDNHNIFLKTIVDLPKNQICREVVEQCRLLLGIAPRNWLYPQVDQFRVKSACALIMLTNSRLQDKIRAILIDEIINAYIRNYMKVLYINTDIVPMCLMDIVTTLATSMCSKFDLLIKLLCRREYANDGKRLIEERYQPSRFEIRRLSDYDTWYMTNPLVNRLYQIVYTKYSGIIVAGTTSVNILLMHKYNNNLPLVVHQLLIAKSTIVKKATDELITTDTIVTMSKMMSHKINDVIISGLESPNVYVVTQRFLECGYRPFNLIKLMNNHKHHRVYKLLQMFAG